MAFGISSLLFVPGSRPDRTHKALAADADIVCIDLEDAVAPADKECARTTALAAIAEGNPRLALRVNGLATRAGLADLLALADAQGLPTALLVPMVESAEELRIVKAVLGDRTPGLIPLIETVRGIAAAPAIASAPGVVAVAFGGADFAGELGVEVAWEPLRAARGALVMACAGAGVPAIDVPYIHLDDEAGLRAETEAAAALGFTAKAAIHPAQIPVINAVMRPSAEQIAEAEAAERAFAAAGGAAVRFNGRMLEAPIMRRYRRILARQGKQNA